MLAIISLLGFSALCASVSVHTHTLHEKRDTGPLSPWTKGGRLEKTAVLPMRIGLKQTNIDKAMEYLLDVSHPKSPNYGKHWTQDEVISTFAPSEESVNAVRDWLVSAGIPGERIVHTDNKGWLAFDATVEEAENLLLAEYHEFEHSSRAKFGVAVDAYHVPKHLAGHVDYITPGVAPKAFKKTSKHLARHSANSAPLQSISRRTSAEQASSEADSLADCYKAVTVSCIRALYNISARKTSHKPNPNNSLGLYEAADVYIQSDLDAQFSTYTPNIPNGTHPILAGIDGGGIATPWNSSVNATLYDVLKSLSNATALEIEGVFAHSETALDLGVIYPLIYPQTVTLYQMFDPLESTPFQSAGYENFLDAIDGSFCSYTFGNQTGNDPKYDGTFPDPLAPNSTLSYKGKLQCGIYRPTNVVSISYSGFEYMWPPVHVKRICNEFTKLSLQGHTFIFASGDSGQALNNGTCIGAEHQAFAPKFPTSCPAVLGVGATMIEGSNSVSAPEVVAYNPASFKGRGFYSGGGFSNVFTAPSYQEDAVNTFLTQHDPQYPYYKTTNGLDPNEGLGRYNRIGRGYPDVSANGGPIPIFVEGIKTPSNGTSVAVPIWASIFNLINEERLAANKSTVGFVNPALYAKPQVLNDITEGHGHGCNTTGFSAAKGWDPITGLGTPNYPKLLELFMSMP